METKSGGKCAQRPEIRDDGSEKWGKVCPTSGKWGRWEHLEWKKHLNSAVAAGMEFRSNGWNALVFKGNGWKPAVPGKRLEFHKGGGEVGGEVDEAFCVGATVLHAAELLHWDVPV